MLSEETQRLIEDQVEREEGMVQAGIDRFRDGLEDLARRNEGSKSKPTRRLLAAALPEAGPYLHAQALAYESQTKSGKRLRTVRGVLEVGAEAAVVIGLKCAFQGISNHLDLRAICLNIGREVQIQLWACSLRKDDPKRFARIFKAKNTTVRRKKLSIERQAEEREYEHWSHADELRVGAVIVNALLVSTGIFQTESRYSHQHGHNIKFLALTADASECLQELHELLSLTRPLYRPMVVPPTPWKAYEGGPYITDAANLRTVLVRGRASPKLINSAIESGDMSEALGAINTLQSTAYRINTRVLEVVEWAWKLDLGGQEGLKKLPRASLVDLPEIPEDASEDQVRQLKKDRKELRELNRAIEAGALAFHTAMLEAKELASYDRFYLPHNFDFRGRVYPIPHFNHQREDYISALFEFSDGVPLGQHGHKWLANQLASTSEWEEVHKRPLQERVAWAERRSEQFISIARDPYTNTEWITAAKPFGFLSGCYEWMEAHRVGPNYASRLPIALDGSNSGIQHYSAALRSRPDAVLVNLTDTEYPQDLYSAVAGRVLGNLEGGHEDAERRPLPGPYGGSILVGERKEPVDEVRGTPQTVGNGRGLSLAYRDSIDSRGGPPNSNGLQPGTDPRRGPNDVSGREDVTPGNSGISGRVQQSRNGGKVQQLPSCDVDPKRKWLSQGVTRKTV